MKWYEINEATKAIEFDFDDGTVEGYSVDSSDEQLHFWLGRHGFKDETLETKIRDSYHRIAFINNINVDENSRGQGIGNDLIDSFESEAKAQSVNAIFLIADLAESQNEGFDLMAWYESHGYKMIKDHLLGPLMFKAL